MGVAWKLRLAAGMLWLPFALLGAIIALTGFDRVPQSAPLSPSTPLPPIPDADRTRVEADQWAALARAASRFDEAEKLPGMAPDAAALAQALTERRHAVANARELVRDRTDEFQGKGSFRADFERVAQADRATREAKRELDDWLARPLKAPERKDIAEFLDGLDSRLAAYRKGDTADRQFAATAELEGREKAIRAFGQALLTRYGRALDDTQRLFDQFAALGDDTDELLKDYRDTLSLAEKQERNRLLSPAAAELVKRLRGELAEWSARRDLLRVVADFPDDLKPAEARFAEAKAVYDRTKDAKFQAALRTWAQRYCSRFLPEKVALDGTLAYGDRPVAVARRDVMAVYARRGDASDTEEKALTDDPGDDKVNEFRLRDTAPSGYAFVALRHGEREIPLTELKPTDATKAARAYHVARRKASLWSPALIAAMQTDVCEEFLRLEGVAKPGDTAGPDEDAAYDRKRSEAKAKVMRVLNARPAIGGTRAARVWDRLAVLADAAKKAPELFDADGS